MHMGPRAETAARRGQQASPRLALPPGKDSLEQGWLHSRQCQPAAPSCQLLAPRAAPSEPRPAEQQCRDAGESRSFPSPARIDAGFKAGIGAGTEQGNKQQDVRAEAGKHLNPSMTRNTSACLAALPPSTPRHTTPLLPLAILCALPPSQGAQGMPAEIFKVLKVPDALRTPCGQPGLTFPPRGGQ